MIPSLLLLSASLLATPVVISEVKATREAGHLRVDVVGDAGIDPEGARTRLDNGVLLIYLGGTRVREDNRAWDLDEGAGQIRAHRHKFETELVVPLAGNGCAGPVELTGSKNGITALVGCDGAMPSVKAARIPVVAKTRTKSLTDEDKIKELVQLPATAPAAEVTALPAPVAPAVVVAEAPKPRVASAPPIVEGPRPRVESALVLAEASKPRVESAAALAEASKPRVESAAVLAEAPKPRMTSPGGALPFPLAAPPAVPTAESAGKGLRAVALPALLLGGLALVAYLFARRRRGSMPRHIQIMETASLGPKRSLIVARVGDETLILGSSEAGITLIRGGTGGFGAPVLAVDPFAPVVVAPAVVAPAVMASAVLASAVAAPAVVAPAVVTTAEEDNFEITQPLEEALADIPEPDSPRVTNRGGFRAIEGGLAGLFGRRAGDSPRTAEPDNFDDLLEDSVEDQELRRKLAAGMSARVR